MTWTLTTTIYTHSVTFSTSPSVLHQLPPTHLSSHLSIINSDNLSVRLATIRPPNHACIVGLPCVVWLCASARQLWARKLNLVKSDGRPKVGATTGRWRRGTHTHTRAHTNTHILSLSISVSLFHMCLFPCLLSLSAVSKHSYFALPLHKLQHLPPDGQNLCVCVSVCWGGLLSSYARYNVLNCILAATITIYMSSMDVSQSVPFQWVPVDLPENMYFLIFLPKTPPPQALFIMFQQTMVILGELSITLLKRYWDHESPQGRQA